MSGVILVAIALGLDNFAVAVGVGLSGVDRHLRLRIALVFGIFEAAMPLIGLLIGRQLAHRISSGGNYLGGGLLIATGIYTLVETRWGSTGELPSSTRTGRLVATSAALSIDNLIVGFALGAYKVPVVLSALVIGVVSVGMSLVGLELGSRMGVAVEKWSEFLVGAILIAVGVAVASGLL
jgi:putative Mn2+ efflux pump MntP